MSAITTSVPSEPEREVFGHRQRHPGREDPFDHRGVGQVQQQHKLARF
jgi:hypothetical protein